jgi:hypothetical protein
MPRAPLPPAETHALLHGNFSGKVFTLDGRRHTILGVAVDDANGVFFVVTPHDGGGRWRIVDVRDALRVETEPNTPPLGATEAGLGAFDDAWAAPPAPLHRDRMERLGRAETRLLRALAARFGPALDDDPAVEPVLSAPVDPEDDAAARALSAAGIVAVHETTDLRSRVATVTSVTFTRYGWKVLRARAMRAPGYAERRRDALRDAWAAAPAPLHHARAAALGPAEATLLRALAAAFATALDEVEEEEDEDDVGRALALPLAPADEAAARTLAALGALALHETVRFDGDGGAIETVMLTEFGCGVARALLAER